MLKINIPIDGSLGSLGDERSMPSDLSRFLGKKSIRFQYGLETVQQCNTSPLVFSALMSFTGHVPLRIEPAHFWVTILQEVATMVKQNPRKYAAVFNGDPDAKKTIQVLCNELAISDEFWPLAIGRFRDGLATETGTDFINGFFPGFSTDTSERELVYLVSVMDAASPFYKFEVFTMCGIPEVHLEGTLEDWRSIYQRVEWLEKTFGKNEYFERLKSMIYQIGQQFYTGKPDIKWWSSCFKYEQQSWGFEITGWLTDLYAHVYREGGPVWKTSSSVHMMDEFPSGLSIVPFIWQLYEQRLPMRFFSGLTGVSVVGGALSANIGYGVIEGES